MNKFLILLVEDDDRILNFLRSKLNALGYKVLTARNGVEALEQVRAQEPDLMVLDLLMPKLDGFETIKELRNFSSIPVIILTAKDADTDKIKGLELGADDYLPKPFNPDELVTRIEAVRRRIEPAEKRKTMAPLTLGNVVVDFNRHNVIRNGLEVYLTRIEWLLLGELSRNVGRLMTYDKLLSQVWGPEYRDDVQLLRTWVSRLRYKLEADPGTPTLISTIPKAGYILNLPLR